MESSQEPLVNSDPLWKHATKLASTKHKGGNSRIRCNICNNEFTGSYSRVKAHLLRIKGQGVAICTKVTDELFNQLRRELAEAEERKRPIDIPLPPSSHTPSDNAWQGVKKMQMEGSKRKAVDMNNPINKAFNMEIRAQLNGEIARSFYSGGLPFHFARNPYYIRSYILAANSNILGYVPPTYNALRTTLLQKERTHVERLMEPIKTTWKEKGVTIVSDGWSDSQRRPLINFMAVTENGPMFLKAVNCEGELKDKFHIADLIKEVILEVGTQNIVQVISDNAPVCKAAGKPSLHLMYDMWDDMIEKVKNIIYRHERKELTEDSTFHEVVYAILIDRWTKSSSALHCLAHSLNPRYYSSVWLGHALDRVPPHQDTELSEERNKCLKRYFPNNEARTAVNTEFARFSGQIDIFGSPDSIEDRCTMDPKMWWLIHGASTRNIQKIALRLLGQPCSSSCCERNWSTYFFIHSLRRNKILPTRAEDLVYVHNNLRLLSRKTDQYLKGETKLWDVGGDKFDPLDGAEELEIANLSLDEPDLESTMFQDD